jgi:membrane complex biogenesis BtpA family protein
MSRGFLASYTSSTVAVLGMLHLAPLPGSPRYDGPLARIRERLLWDAEALAAGGVDGFVLENFGDAPFYPKRVPAHVVAHMSVLASEVSRHYELPLGINCLRNDALAALAIAQATGAAFIRVNVLCGARVTDQGIIEGQAHALLRERASLNATHIAVLGDVDVKHSTPVGTPRPLAQEVDDLVTRGMADGVVVSGAATGSPTDVAHLRAVREAAPDVPVLVGSGVHMDNVDALVPLVDGLIVGTSLKRDGVATNPVDLGRVRELMARLRTREESALLPARR